MARSFLPLVIALAACGPHEADASGEVHASGPALGTFDLFPNGCSAAVRGVDLPGGGQRPSVSFTLDDVTDEKIVAVLPEGQTTRTLFHAGDCAVFEIDVHVDGSVRSSRYGPTSATWGGSAHVSCAREGVGTIEVRAAYSDCR